MRRSPLLRSRVVAAVAVAALAVGACGDEGPISGPGTLTAVVSSPNGSEGAAVVTLIGEGVGAVTALDGWLFEERIADGVRVMVVNDQAGPLRFQVALADTTQRPVGTVEEVAGPDDVLRSLATAGYTVEFIR
ncbi:MAG: hypothetical protein RJQ04_10780 [Longimicrobiales bacterium]